MSLDRTDQNTTLETSERPPQSEQTPPPDNPGTSGSRTRAESRAAARGEQPEVPEANDKPETNRDKDSQPTRDRRTERDTPAEPASRADSPQGTTTERSDTPRLDSKRAAAGLPSERTEERTGTEIPPPAGERPPDTRPGPKQEQEQRESETREQNPATGAETGRPAESQPEVTTDRPETTGDQSDRARQQTSTAPPETREQDGRWTAPQEEPSESGREPTTPETPSNRDASSLGEPERLPETGEQPTARKTEATQGEGVDLGERSSSPADNGQPEGGPQPGRTANPGPLRETGARPVEQPEPAPAGNKPGETGGAGRPETGERHRTGADSGGELSPIGDSEIEEPRSDQPTPLVNILSIRAQVDPAIIDRGPDVVGDQPVGPEDRPGELVRNEESDKRSRSDRASGMVVREAPTVNKAATKLADQAGKILARPPGSGHSPVKVSGNELPHQTPTSEVGVGGGVGAALTTGIFIADMAARIYRRAKVKRGGG
jgi:hypothetical protein